MDTGTHCLGRRLRTQKIQPYVHDELSYKPSKLYIILRILNPYHDQDQVWLSQSWSTSFDIAFYDWHRAGLRLLRKAHNTRSQRVLWKPRFSTAQVILCCITLSLRHLMPMPQSSHSLPGKSVYRVFGQNAPFSRFWTLNADTPFWSSLYMYIGDGVTSSSSGQLSVSSVLTTFGGLFAVRRTG